MNKLSIVKDVIDEWDPQNFLKSGCPDDEYEVEIQGIVVVLEIVNGPKELAIEINCVEVFAPEPSRLPYFINVRNVVKSCI